MKQYFKLTLLKYSNVTVDIESICLVDNKEDTFLISLSDQKFLSVFEKMNSQKQYDIIIKDCDNNELAYLKECEIVNYSSYQKIIEFKTKKIENRDKEKHFLEELINEKRYLKYIQDGLI